MWVGHHTRDRWAPGAPVEPGAAAGEGVPGALEPRRPAHVPPTEPPDPRSDLRAAERPRRVGPSDDQPSRARVRVAGRGPHAGAPGLPAHRGRRAAADLLGHRRPRGRDRQHAVARRQGRVLQQRRLRRALPPDRDGGRRGRAGRGAPAGAYGVDARRVDVTWGRAVDPDLVREELAKEKGKDGAKAVMVTHNETSTGALNPLKEIAAVVRDAGKLL